MYTKAFVGSLVPETNMIKSSIPKYGIMPPHHITKSHPQGVVHPTTTIYITHEVTEQ
jgi:hypothetical protein